jgi:hypothetical protein
MSPRYTARVRRAAAPAARSRQRRQHSSAAPCTTPSGRSPAHTHPWPPPRPCSRHLRRHALGADVRGPAAAAGGRAVGPRGRHPQVRSGRTQLARPPLPAPPHLRCWPALQTPTPAPPVPPRPRRVLWHQQQPDTLLTIEEGAIHKWKVTSTGAEVRPAQPSCPPAPGAARQRLELRTRAPARLPAGPRLPAAAANACPPARLPAFPQREAKMSPGELQQLWSGTLHPSKPELACMAAGNNLQLWDVRAGSKVRSSAPRRQQRCRRAFFCPPGSQPAPGALSAGRKPPASAPAHPARPRGSAAAAGPSPPARSTPAAAAAALPPCRRWARSRARTRCRSGTSTLRRSSSTGWCPPATTASCASGTPGGGGRSGLVGWAGAQRGAAE